MAGPWEKYGQQAGGKPWEKYQGQAPVAAEPRIERASILPFSKNLDTGEVSFDPDAGILGAIKSGVMLPGDVATGKVAPQSGEGMRRMLDFSMMATPVNPAIRAGERAIPGALKALKPGRPAVPTAEALKESSEAGFEAARTMGVDYSAAAVKSLADDAARELQDQGILAELTPKTFSILRKLQEPPADSVASIEGLIAARRALNNAAGDFTNPTERLAANRVIDRLDEFIKGRDAESVVAGPAPAASRALEDARGDYAAAMRSERVTGAEERAQLNAGVTNSGNNLDNQIRQRLRDILTKPKESRGFSKEELALIRKAATGGFGAKTARWVGNLLGGGGGLGRELTAALGMAVGGTVGGFTGAGVGAVTLPMIGAVSRKVATNLTQARARALDEAIRKRSPLYKKALENPPMEVVSPELRASVMRALLLQQSGAQQ